MLGNAKISTIAPKINKRIKKTASDAVWNLLLQENATVSLIHDYTLLEQSIPPFQDFQWRDINDHLSLLEKYHWLLDTSNRLYELVNTVLSEDLDKLFISIRVDDPEDNDLDIFVNQGEKILLLYRKQLETIVYRLNNNYLLPNNAINTHLLKATEQKNISHASQKQLKDIHYEMVSLVNFLGKLNWS